MVEISFEVSSRERSSAERPWKVAVRACLPLKTAACLIANAAFAASRCWLIIGLSSEKLKKEKEKEIQNKLGPTVPLKENVFFGFPFYT